MRHLPEPAEADTTAGPVGDEVICHGDFGSWNTVWRGARPVGIIDGDHARPAPRLHDVAYALQYTVPFRDDAMCLRWLRYPQPPDRRHRLEVFAAACALAPSCPRRSPERMTGPWQRPAPTASRRRQRSAPHHGRRPHGPGPATGCAARPAAPARPSVTRTRRHGTARLPHSAS
ncbi:phosphotransferase [Streptomyces sp. NRRL WC-3742]|uniref:phosphotransferase n=1 Tax=Streptomyces sp. NRRL WC-3742 TaxID=1463934 RepID=UPI00099B9ACD